MEELLGAVITAIAEVLFEAIFELVLEGTVSSAQMNTKLRTDCLAKRGWLRADRGRSGNSSVFLLLPGGLVITPEIKS